MLELKLPPKSKNTIVPMHQKQKEMDEEALIFDGGLFFVSADELAVRNVDGCVNSYK